MDIHYVLGRENGVDPLDPLGDIVFIDNNGNSLTLAETFIDVWLVELLQAFRPPLKAHEFSISVLEEPYQIEAKSSDGIVRLNSRGEEVEASLSELSSGLEAVTQRFVLEMARYDGVEGNEAIRELAIQLCITW